MIRRDYYLNQIQEAFEIHSVTAILGPRQSGKTTLAKLYAQGLSHVHFFDLENPQDLAILESASLALAPLQGTIVIDEIQRRPELFPYLRFLADNSDKKFLILGSASQDLIQQSSETLAGRITYIELPPFLLWEINDMEKHWLRGGYPKSFLASSNSQSENWRVNYIKTFLERDLSMMGIQTVSSNMRRLWSMLAHYHGQIANISELSRSLDMNDKTIRRYMDILEGCFMIRQLKPWHENLSKRQVKRSKLYIRDSGLFHTLLGITATDICRHPKCGASWEGYALENLIQSYGNDLYESYFWATEKGAELDLLVIKGDQRFGYEFKYSEAPKITKSMHIALEDLKLDHLTIITPGARSYPLSEHVKVQSLSDTIRLVKNS
ncbi:ATP-binding protein [Candidatus Odyssella thessalonicensis]|uniref:ATP-binding protein n=1 Tax=Candidatus Odyssella thessalonicensis TaxID=84647 RepID=UPI000225AC94|nr:ATP-binding protein [Candidatus Odyssella thessalonicensis]